MAHIQHVGPLPPLRILTLLSLTFVGPSLAQDAPAEATPVDPRLPLSTAEGPSSAMARIEISRAGVFLDGALVCPIVERRLRSGSGESYLATSSAASTRTYIPELHERLLILRHDALAQQDDLAMLAQLAQDPSLAPADGVELWVDREIPYTVLRKVLWSVGRADFALHRFVVHNPWTDQHAGIDTVVAVPEDDDEVEGDTAEEAPMGLVLTIHDKGMVPNGPDALLYPDGAPLIGAPPLLPCLSGERCEGVDDYDWEGLNRVMAQVKDAYPEHVEIWLEPTWTIQHEVIVRALDYLRWGPFLPMDAEHDSWEVWRDERRELFPHASLGGGAQ